MITPLICGRPTAACSCWGAAITRATTNPREA